MNNLKNMQYGSEIITYLNNIKSEIELYNGFKLYNINKFAEYFYSEFLNLLFGYELEIMEKVNPNMVAIDLGDKNGKIAIQITSDISREKIKETIEKYNKNGLDKIYKRLVVLHIANETPNYNKPHTIEQFNLKEDVWNIEYLLSQMPIENIDKLKSIRDFLKKYVEDSPQISNLDNFLKERYKNKNFTKLKPLSSLNKDVYIKDIYQDLSIIKKREKEDEKDEEIIIDRVLNNFKKVAILGKAGIGKSTLSKYICYQWANGQLFDDYEYLFYIPIRKWEKGEGIFDVVLKVLKKSNNENIKIEADDLYEYIKNFNNATLFVIDGFDEIRNEDQEDIKKEIQNLNNYIITSRHDGLKNNELNIEKTFENEGFNQKSIENFIGHIENSHELTTYINENVQLKELSKIPMLLDMICYLYKENPVDFNTNFTMTSLYEKFLDEIIFRFEEERESQSSKVTKEDDDIFFELGKIAFDNLKNKRFKFKGSFITRSNRKFIENELLPFGFILNLTNERHLNDREYEFIHTSFQEYFSALYVSKLEPTEQSEKIQESKFYPHMQMFFAFLGGLIDDKELLLREIESEQRDILGYYELLLLSNCLKEIKNYNNQNFIKDLNHRIIFYLNRLIFLSTLEGIHGRDSFLDLIKNILESIQHNYYLHTSDILEELIHLINSSRGELYLGSAIAMSLHVLSQYKFSFEKDIRPFLNNNVFLDFQSTLLGEHHTFPSNLNEKEYEIKAKKHQYSLTAEQSHMKITNDKEFRKALLYILRLPVSKENMYAKKNAMESLQRYLDINDNESINLALEIILTLDEYIDIGEGSYLFHWATQLILSVEREDDEFIEMLLNALKDKRLDKFPKKREIIIRDYKFFDSEIHDRASQIRYAISPKLFKINNYRPSFIEELIYIIEKEYILLSNTILSESILKDMMSIEIFERLWSSELDTFKTQKEIVVFFGKLDTSANSYKYNQNAIFLKNIKIDVLFKAYDKEYNIDFILMTNLILSKKPLYLKNNKLHTIENGKEISTQREVDEATLNEIKMLIKGDEHNN